TERDECCIKAAKCAASNGQLKVVKFFISCLSSPDRRVNLRFQCAVAACSRLHEDVVVFLGLEPDWLFQSSTILSFTAAMAIEGSNSVLTDTLSRMQPARITQLLRLSISQRHVALAVTLINDERVSTEHVDRPDSTGATALMLAADAGHHELIEKLIDLGASVRAEDSQGRTALSRACEAGHVRAVRALMDRGADASHRDGRGLSCVQVAQLFKQRQVLRLLDRKAQRPGRHPLIAWIGASIDDSQQDRFLSEELHRLLSNAGFTEQRARCQQRLADWLQGVAGVLTQDGNRRQMTGSYAEGWANNLVQVNGRTAADSDIDWTVLVAGQQFHLAGGCDRHWEPCRDAILLQVKEGHAQVAVGAGSQPAVTATACGVRPAQDTCHAIECCSSFCEDRVRKLLGHSFNKVHLIRATRPSSTNELRVSFSFQEKHIMRDLSTVQGQLFTLIKFIFKRHLPLTLDTPGLKTYHAKTLLFTMLEKHGADPKTKAWQPHNLIALLKESLDMMLSFIDSSSSPDECMPHFFIPDAPLYFKNAGIGGDFDNTKARVRDRLCELRSDIGGVVRAAEETHVYSVVHQCVSELQSESSDRDTLMRQLSLLHKLQWCKCAALCMTAMAHLKFGESEKAERLAMELQRHQVESGLKPQDIRDESNKIKLSADSDWAWRFCLPCDSPPRFPFLPEFTQTLFTARLSQPLSSHLYVNFRCLSWSLQAELLRNRAPAIAFDHWIEQLLGDPDLEELLALAHYSDCRKHVELSLQQMEMIEKERRVAMETQDEEKIGWLRQKLERLNDAEVRVAKTQADVNLRRNSGESPLYIASEQEILEAVICSPSDSELSHQLHSALEQSGFTESRAALQSAAADVLQQILRSRLNYDNFFVIGSYSEGWGNSLTTLDGRTDSNSDIDVMCLIPGREYHQRGLCECDGAPEQHELVNGHIQISGFASNPAAARPGCTLRPAMDNVSACRLCRYPPIAPLLPNRVSNIPHSVLEALRKVLTSASSPCHVVHAASPDRGGEELRVSTSFLENRMLRSLSTLQ
uniref:ANK_REP_REGION domain-containing protein n=1 Tax=Macrostomum lignano TaxID=282301 RepID=A0A1I8H6Q3_9PLAT